MNSDKAPPMTVTTAITAQVERAMLEAIDRHLDARAPGQLGYFASRSEFVREALRRQLDFVAAATSAPLAPVRQRTRATA